MSGNELNATNDCIRIGLLEFPAFSGDAAPAPCAPLRIVRD